MLFVTAGELTALSALQADLTDGPDTDNRTEPWAKIAQDRVEIAGGFFALDIADRQGLFNLSNLRPATDLGAAPPDSRILTALVASLELADDLTARISQRMAQDPPVTALSDLTAEQVISPAEAAALAEVVTVLPLPTEINLNAAPLPVLTALTDNPPQARLLDGIRSRNGLLTAADLASVHLVQDARSGFTSAFFGVTVAVTVGQTEQVFSSLIFRDAKAEDGRVLRIVSRHRQIIEFPATVTDSSETLAAVQPLSE